MDTPALTLLGLCVSVAVFGVGTGRLGLGIAVLAAPTLSLFLHHNMAMVLPFSLALNAATCVTTAVLFAFRDRSSWRHALDLTAITAVLRKHEDSSFTCPLHPRLAAGGYLIEERRDALPPKIAEATAVPLFRLKVSYVGPEAAAEKFRVPWQISRQRIAPT
jgi:hypothetical protein